MLELQNVKKTFFAGTANEKKALRGVSFTLDDGDFCTVIGSNGAGKSTTLNAIAGVFPIDSGSIKIDGVEISKMPEWKRASMIGRVFQDPMRGTAAGMMISENLAVADRRGRRPTLRWSDRADRNARFAELGGELTEEQKQEIVNYEALLTKSMTVEFVADTAQFKNPEEAYAIMDEFVSIANTLDGAIIQVEGNINARNYSDSGQALSAERAKAVAKYFIACGIDPNRLITVGNGNTKMVADPGSADAYLNRRTDVFFKIIEE